MKKAKRILFGLVLSMFVVSLSAQTGAGKFLIGGSSSFSFSATTDKEKSDLLSRTTGKGIDLSLAPQVGFFVIDGLAVGLEFNIGLSSYKWDGTDIKQNSTVLVAAPFVRYYYGTNKIKPFAEASLGLGTRINKYKNGDVTTTGNTGIFGFGAGIGAAVFLNDNVSVDLGIGYSSMSTKVKDDPDNEKDITSGIIFQVGISVIL